MQRCSHVTAHERVIWSAYGHLPTSEGLAMRMEAILLAVLVFGGAAAAMIASFVLAKYGDEARRMVHDKRQHHYGGDLD